MSHILPFLLFSIAHRFAHYFASMGFAGDVVLHEGEDVNDFHNYGFDILVKYRHSAQLQVNLV